MRTAAAPETAATVRSVAPLDTHAFLATPPPVDSPEARAELERVRTIQQTSSPERRAQAAVDSDIDVWKAFAAPLGIAADDTDLLRQAGALAALVRASVLAAGSAKLKFTRPRPFVTDPTLAICVPTQRLAIAQSYSYPSGHATLGWTVALLLAEMAPERAEAILLRGREFGDSRVICGVHYPSDVEAGRLAAAGLVARLHADPAFAAAFATARSALHAAQANP
jgi:acid phosphatase (class A)